MFSRWIRIIAFMFLASGPLFAGFVESVSSFSGDYATVPKQLSLTGMYSDFATRQLSPDVIPYEVNSPLWSDADASYKHRYIWLPQGASIVPNDSIGWDYPDGAVVVKNFSLDTIVGDVNSVILIETRLLVKQTDQWYYLTYEWKLDQTEAYLVNDRYGKDAIFRRWDNGQLVHWRWNYPSKSQCMQCHQLSVGAVGINGPNMNRESALTPGKNQLEDLVDKGILSKNLLAETPNLHRWYNTQDASATTEQKARSFLAMNCGYCHSNEYKAGGAHSFSYWTENQEPDYLDMESFAEVGYPKFVYAGRPDSSYILKRMTSRGTFVTKNYSQMPPLGTFLVPEHALKAVSDWICQLGGQPEGCNPMSPDPGPSVEEDEFVDDPAWWMAAVKNNSLTSVHFPVSQKNRESFDLRFAGQQLQLFGNLNMVREILLRDLHGKSIPLKNLGNGSYFIPQSLSAGVYTLSINGRAHKIHYLN